MIHFRRVLVALLAVMVSMALPVATSAQETNAGVPGGPFASNFQIQNLGGADATCSYTMYNDSGTQAFAPTSAFTVKSGDSYAVLTTSVQNFPSGQFGGVVSCDQNVAVVVNWSEANKGDVYVATSNPANTLFASSIYNNYYNFYTTMRIQNASGAAQSVTVEYYGPGSATKVGQSGPFNLAVNGSVTVDQTGIAALKKNTSYAAKIVGAGPLAAVVSIFGGTGTSVANQLYSYSAITGGSAQPSYVPLVFNDYYTYASSLTVLNVGTAETDIRITYIDNAGATVVSQTYSAAFPGKKLAANSSWATLQFNIPQLAKNKYYAAKVESLNGQPIIASVNMSRGALSRAATYTGIAGGNTTVVAPSTYKLYYGYNSTLTCQNVGTAATNLTISYSGSGPKNKLVKSGLAKGAAFEIQQSAEAGLANGFIGSATVKSSGQPIVCVVTQDRVTAPYSTEAKDYFQSYVSIGQ